MFLIAQVAQGLARWDGAEREGKGQANSKGHLTEKFSQEARGREDDARAENGPADFHRQVDTQSFVFAEREALSSRAVAPLPWKRLPTDAHKNSPQSRIDRINHQARYESEGHCCRVFLDRAGKDNHHSTQGHVPLGKTTRQGRECRRIPSASVRDAMSEGEMSTFLNEKRSKKRRTA